MTDKRMVPNGMAGGSSFVGPAEVCACGTALTHCHRCEGWRCLTCDPLGTSACETRQSRKMCPPHKNPERTRRLAKWIEQVGYRKWVRRG